MRILFFSRLFYPHIGGVEKHLYEISRILIKKGHHVSIITQQHEPEIQLEENYEGIHIYRIPYAENSFWKKFLIWQWVFVNRCVIQKADVVHCHDVFFWYLPFRFIFPKKRAFTTFHGYEAYPIPKKALFVRKVSEIFSNGTMCIGDYIIKWYGTRADVISYGGVRLPKKNREYEDKMSAVFVGRLDEQTNIKEYARAVKKIKKKFPAFSLTVVGDGELRSVIKKGTKWVGAKQDPTRYFEQARFAFVSRYLSILEAMALKRLVVALYDNPLKEDYLKLAPFANYIVIASSSEELAAKINYFLKHTDEEKKLVSAAYKWVVKQTWEVVVGRYLSLWRKQ